MAVHSFALFFFTSSGQEFPSLKVYFWERNYFFFIFLSVQRGGGKERKCSKFGIPLFNF
jgi:hypothetical protein